MNSERPSLLLHRSQYVKGFTLRRNLAAVMSVENPSASVPTLIIIKEFKLEREPTHACNVAKHLVMNQNVCHIRKLTNGEKPCRCGDCGKGFQKYYLSVPQRTQTNEKPYRCNECGKSSKDTTIFNVLQRIHTEERPCECRDCGEALMCSYPSLTHQHIHF
ncbi:zinc finger protein 180-like [Mus caroli]|uniref:Zinc finger protein 180-like n=1 Tax=Mus caroli TaxID=10089 RepID=A0A6P5QLC9_MUSCR|nr:zinc finger protein 180-like [Mus caroli]